MAFITPTPLSIRSSTRPKLCTKPHPPQRQEVRMVQQQDTPTLPKPAPQSPSSPPSTPSHADALDIFRAFFAAMPGSWNSQRTYHYLSAEAPSEREESQTTFDVERLSTEQVRAVLASNDSVLGNTETAEGFRVSFLTRMELQDELVRSGTNLAFVPDGGSPSLVLGSYYRDLGYEERGPVKARFLFDADRNELRMTTYYTRVVSVDEIRLINERVRLRRIVNYRRPGGGEELTEPLLVGYGVEVRGEEKRLVE